MAKKLWGGRFKKKVNKEFFRFQKSISYDYKLANYDILHSRIHIVALKNAKILTPGDAKKMDTALKQILKGIRNKTFKPNLASEDIHTDVQNRVEKKCGKLALKLQTFRSRNDQIVFCEKGYCDDESGNIADLLGEVISSLEFLAVKYKGFHFVGYTHTQRAEKIAFMSYIAAFESMFTRDKERLLEFRKKLTLYIGSGAFKGSSLIKNYDRAIKEFLKKTFEKALSGKIKAVENPPDNVSDRDFIIEFLSILSIVQMHLSRLAEDFILFSTNEFNYMELPEDFCTGSSLMPHKKNPDFMELIRGYTGRIYGNLASILTTMKGLPLTYNRDMQLDKEPLFSSVEIIKDELAVLADFIKGIRLNRNAIVESLKDESLYATALAEYLVKKKIPFGTAHEIVGKLIRYSEDNKCKIRQMGNETLKRFSHCLNKKVVDQIFE
ncbi:MAG: argininosuccinate lyase [Candidatus Omnitrophica bacterium]|nr:argininosuccinate lyase [Candidatus Omnitrophota bacterium]